MTWIFIKKIFLFDDTQHGMLRLIIVSLILRTNLSNKFDKIVCFILCLIYLWTNLNRTLIKFLRLMKLWNYEQNRMVANVHKIMLKFKFISGTMHYDIFRSITRLQMVLQNSINCKHQLRILQYIIFVYTN